MSPLTFPHTFIPSTIAKASDVNANFNAVKVAFDALSIGSGVAVMTQAQRDALATPATGVVIFNTTTNKLNVRIPTGWDVLGTSAASGALATIGITPLSAPVQTGATQQFTATGYDANGVVIPITPVWAVNATPGGPVTLTVFASPADGHLDSRNADYLTARAGSGLSPTVSTSGGMANDLFSGNYVIQELFLQFDTSPIPDTATINTVVFSGQGIGSSFGTGWVMQARAHDWGTTLETTDFVAGANVAAKTLLATRAFAGDWSTSAYNAFTSEVAFLAAINKTGYTRMFVHVDTIASATAPSGSGLAGANTLLSGSAAPAKLVITYTP